MKTYKEALALIQGAAVVHSEHATKKVSLRKALGRTSAFDIVSPELLPALSNSAVDGFAVRSSETWGATPEAAISFSVVGSIIAGDVAPEIGDLSKRSAWEIMTGAPFPAGFDTAVKIEDVRVKRDATGRALSIEITQESESEEYLRPAGEDYQVGSSVLKAGTVITSEHILALSALGFTDVEVLRKLRVALISTGKEIAESTHIEPGQIRNSSTPYLVSALEQLGVKITSQVNVGDDPTDFFRELGRSFENSPDLIITTGAVSMGKHDFIPSVLKDLGAEILFHQVAIRPGKPLLFAKIPKGPVVFGLPGNPVSTVVGLRFFVEPFLRTWSGRKSENPVRARLKSTVKKVAGLQCFFKAKVELGESAPEVTVLAGQPSFMISPLLESTAWAVLPQAASEVRAGEWIDVYPLHAWDGTRGHCWSTHSNSVVESVPHDEHQHLEVGGCC